MQISPESRHEMINAAYDAAPTEDTYTEIDDNCTVGGSRSKITRSETEAMINAAIIRLYEIN